MPLMEKAVVAAAHVERQRAVQASARTRAAIAQALCVMSVQEVEIAMLEREVVHSTCAPFRPTATLARAHMTALRCVIGRSQVETF